MTRLDFKRACLGFLGGLGGIYWMEAADPAVRWDFDECLVAPLRVHLLVDPAVPPWSTTLTEDDTHRILGKINGIWAQAGIQFYLESLVCEAPRRPVGFSLPDFPPDFRWMLSLRPVESQTNSTFHLYYLKEMRGNGVFLGEAMFVKDTASLQPVPGGIDEPIPRVSSHELGHALGLVHRQNVTNLMASGTTGTWLNDGEIAGARAAAKRFGWIESGAQVLKRIQRFEPASRDSEAARWRRRMGEFSLRSPFLGGPPAVPESVPEGR